MTPPGAPTAGSADVLVGSRVLPAAAAEDAEPTRTSALSRLAAKQMRRSGR